MQQQNFRKGRTQSLMEINHQRSRQTTTYHEYIKGSNVFFLLRQTENQSAGQSVWVHYKKIKGFAPGVPTVNFCPDTDSFTLVSTLKQGDK